MNPAWGLLMLVIILEVAGTTCMKLSHGYTHWKPSVLMFVFYAACFSIFPFAVKKLDIGVAYAIWAGLGTAIIALIGIFHFREPVSAIKVVSLVMVILGVIGLKLGASG
ncbi:MAG: multidrug efflux SMR transporter [Bacteriovoracia bacterium]